MKPFQYTPQGYTDNVGRLRDQGFIENFGAAMGYQYGPFIGRTREAIQFGDAERDPQFNYLNEIEGFESFQHELVRAKNKEHAQFIKDGIMSSMANRKTLEKTSWYHPSQLVAGTLDLANLGFAFPVVGQLGLIPRAGMTVGQAAKASAKGGFVAGLAAEAYRAPFDPLSSKAEVFANVLTTTAFGTTIGSIPSIYRNIGPALNKGVNNIKNFHTDRGSFEGGMYEGTKIHSADDIVDTRVTEELHTDAEIVVGPTGIERDGRYISASYDPVENKIRIDMDYIAAQFDKKPWTKPKVKGVDPLPEDEFVNAAEWVEFVKAHEIFHTLNRPEDLGLNPKIASEKAQIENLMNALALDYVRKRRPLDASKPINYDDASDTIYVNDRAVESLFEESAWVVPDVEDADPLLDRDIISSREYKEFLIHKEKLKITDKRKPEETDATYANRINQAALARTREGYGLTKTAFTNSMFYKMITTPGKRILLNDKVPDIAKRYYNLLAGSGAMAIDRNIFGSGMQSIEARSEVHQAKAIALLSSVRQVYDNQTNVISKGLGATLPLYERIRNGMTFDDFFEYHADRYIRQSDGSPVANKTDADKEIDSLFNEFFAYYREFAEDVGAFKTAGDLAESIDRTQKEIARIQKQTAAIESQGEARGYTDKQLKLLEVNKRRLERLEAELETFDFMKESGMISDRFYFPIFYDKKKLKVDPELKARFKSVVAKHIEENPELFTRFWDEKANNGNGAYVERTTVRNPIKIADDIVEDMLNDTVGDIDYNGPPSSKHLRNRQLNIPEHKVADFTIKNAQVILNYSRTMGNRLEYRNAFGRASINDLLDDIEYEAVKEGKLSEAEINKLKIDFKADYERVLGIHIKNPDRLDAQAVRIIQDVAAMSFLHQAGIASVTDAGSIILQHGLQRSFDEGVAKWSHQGRAMSLKQMEKYVVGLDIALNSTQRRVVSDNTIRPDPNAVERVLNPITNAFYNIPLFGNNLGLVTRYFKRVDAPIRANEIIERSRNYDNLGDAEIRDLAILGIDRDLAKKFADMPYEEVDGFYIANLDEWPNATKLDREVRASWETAMNLGVGNSVMMARISERPLLMDGILYVEWKPWMQQLGFVIDESVSSQNIKYTRLESKVMGMPFQFMSFTLAATNRITGSMFDPVKQHRLVGAMSLIGLGYLSLQLKKEDWWFENRSTADIMARSIDASGVLGVYSELGYMAMHSLIGGGVFEGGGKYRPPSFSSSLVDVLGAGPGLVIDTTRGIKDLFDGGDTEQAERLKYLLPIPPLLGLRDDIQDLVGNSITGK